MSPGEAVIHASHYARGHEAGELSLRNSLTPLKRTFSRFFLLLLVLGTLLLAGLMWLQWQHLLDRNELRQRGLVMTVKSGLSSMLSSQEIVLQMLGRRMLDPESSMTLADKVALLDHFRDIDPKIAGYGLAGPDGQLTIVNSDFRPAAGQSMNLMDRPSVREDFARVLQSDGLLIGAPYFVEALDGFLLPLRTAIRDEQGRVEGVMISGLNARGDDSLFPATGFLESGSNIQILRGRDFQPLYWASPDLPTPGLFSSPLSEDLIQPAIESAERRSGLTLAEIQLREAPVTYRQVNLDGIELGMAVYAPAFDFWVLEETRQSRLVGEFWSLAWVFIAVYVLVLGLLFVLLMRIGGAEQRRRQELVHQAEIDSLTGLGNRLRMSNDFIRLRGLQSGRLALMFIDLDNFKTVNDACGHEIGDRVLAGVGAALLTETRAHDCISRVGGDEFVLMTPEVDRSALMERALGLARSIRAASEHWAQGHSIGCGIGIACAPDDGVELGELLRAADAAMYEAKKELDAVRFHDPEMSRRYLETLALEQRLRRAIEERRITLAHQPQVDEQGRITGLEALARWQDEEFGHVPPPRFIALAEANGMIGPLGDLILDLWMEHAARVDEIVAQETWSAFNVSVRQFRQPDFVDNLIGRLQRAPLRHVRPVMEITESLFMEHDEKIIADLERLRHAGIRISMDDFGTGFSSLSRLHRLPLDEIKIDKSFVDRITEDSYTRVLVSSIVSIGRSQQLNVVAEGVETEAQSALLREDGCNIFQGYLISRPLALDDLCEWLRSHVDVTIA